MASKSSHKKKKSPVLPQSKRSWLRRYLLPIFLFAFLFTAAYSLFQSATNFVVAPVEEQATINVVNTLLPCFEHDGDKAGCTAVKGCVWKDGGQVTHTQTKDCATNPDPKQCKCQNVTTTSGGKSGCYFGNTKASGLNKQLCGVEGGTWYTGTTSTTTVCTGTYKVTFTEPITGTCTGTPQQVTTNQPLPVDTSKSTTNNITTNTPSIKLNCCSIIPHSYCNYQNAYTWKKSIVLTPQQLQDIRLSPDTAPKNICGVENGVTLTQCPSGVNQSRSFVCASQLLGTGGGASTTSTSSYASCAARLGIDASLVTAREGGCGYHEEVLKTYKTGTCNHLTGFAKWQCEKFGRDALNPKEIYCCQNLDQFRKKAANSCFSKLTFADGKRLNKSDKQKIADVVEIGCTDTCPAGMSLNNAIPIMDSTITVGKSVCNMGQTVAGVAGIGRKDVTCCVTAIKQ